MLAEKQPPASNELDAFEQDVLNGLKQTQKTLPCRWLYDDRGSQLFERITQLPEYYPTRTETAILHSCVTELAKHVGPQAALIEYGAGASVKTQILLKHLSNLSAYVPIDVSGDFLEETAQRLQQTFTSLAIHPVIADFTRTFSIPHFAKSTRKVGFFPGSTIGNLSDTEIHHFLTSAHQHLGENRQFILGFDLRKSADILIPAYNDADGVTACFNLNLLDRINRELDADFPTQGFKHEARWNDTASRIEMHLVSIKKQLIRIGEHTIPFEAGETIHTENSRKFSLNDMQALCANANWAMREVWMDNNNLFAVTLMEPK